MEIKDRSIKNKSSGSYYRLIGNKAYAQLISQIQSAVIAQGYELEKDINYWIEKNYSDKIIKTLKDFFNIISLKSLENHFYILNTKIYKQFLKNENVKNIKQPDFILILIQNKNVYIVELKEGYDFDTKKSLGEKESLEKIKKDLMSVLPKWQVKYYFCSFYSESKEQVYKGLKKIIDIENLWTGEDFFKFIKLDYNHFVKWRIKKDKSDQQNNYDYIKNIILNN